MAIGDDNNSSGHAEMAKQFDRWMLPGGQLFKVTNNREKVNETVSFRKVHTVKLIKFLIWLNLLKH